MGSDESRDGGGRFAALRKQAESGLGELPADAAIVNDLSAEEVRNLIHELRVHQIELEMQNEELGKTLHELEKMRDRYSDLFHFSPVGYFTLGEGNRIQDVNLVAGELLGKNRRELVGEPLTRFIAKEGQDPFYLLQHRVRTSGEQQRMELKMLKGDGESVDIQIDGLAIRDQDGAVIEQRIVISDISSRKRMERQRSLFFSIAGHELRTPVTNINLSMDMLSQSLSGSLSDQSRKMFHVARINLNRLKRLINDILAIDSLESGCMAFHIKPIELNPLIQEVVESIDAYARSFDVQLRFDQEAPDVMVQADADRLTQVFYNLLNNAVRFSPEGETVRIRLTRSDDKVHAAVIDRGPGIPADFLPHLFEPFTQADPSLEDPHHKGSAGLGLSIAKNIVERLGGRIGLESGEEQGTTFYFELPVWR